VIHEDARPTHSALAREMPARRVRYFNDGSGHAVLTREYQTDQQSIKVADASVIMKIQMN
jgi:hypothetical protein